MLGTVDAGVFVDRQQTDATNDGTDGIGKGNAVAKGVECRCGPALMPLLPA